MDKLLLATAAGAALAFPALAQEQTPSPQPAPTQPGQMQPGQMQPAPPAAMTQGAQVMRPNLARRQIRRVQQALDKNGFGVGRADGVWGASTQAALQNFQTSKGLPPSGQIDQQTLSALNLNPSRFAPRTPAPGAYRTP
jgi:peptidoglycan hydrolase-like protein with peptidoglycan-binding domain